MENANLAKVFGLTKSLAKAIRMNSSYNSEVNPNREDDVMWLSDALHNFDFLENALLEPEKKNALLDRLIATYREYLNPSAQYKSIAMDTFKRYEIDIPSAIAIFESLKN